MPFRVNKKPFVTNELEATDANAADCKSLRKRRENKNRRIKSLSESGGYSMIKHEDLLGCPLVRKNFNNLRQLNPIWSNQTQFNHAKHNLTSFWKWRPMFQDVDELNMRGTFSED